MSCFQNGPVVLPAPAIRRDLDFSRRLGRGQQGQSVFQHHPFLLRVAGRAKGSPKGEPQHQPPGHGQGGRFLAVYHYYYGRYTSGLNSPGNQSTGLMTKGSSSANDHTVNPFFFQTFRRLRASGLDET